MTTTELTVLDEACCPLLPNAPLDAAQAESLARALKVLDDAGLLWREPRGTGVHYGVKEGALEPLVAALSPAG